MGPTWYWMFDIFERFFADFDKKPSDYYELIRLYPAYRVYFEEADYIDIAIKDLVYKPGLSPLELVNLITASRLHLFFDNIKSQVKRQFSNPKLQQILEFPVLFLGAKPSKTPDDGKPYTVFTPYKRKWLEKWNLYPQKPFPKPNFNTFFKSNLPLRIIARIRI